METTEINNNDEKIVLVMTQKGEFNPVEIMIENLDINCDRPCDMRSPKEVETPTCNHPNDFLDQFSKYEDLIDCYRMYVLGPKKFAKMED